MCLAVPGQVISIEGDDPLLRTGKVSFGGAVKVVSLAYVPEVAVGDYVVVHVGFALSRIDEEAAAQTLRDFADIERLSPIDPEIRYFKQLD